MDHGVGGEGGLAEKGGYFLSVLGQAPGAVAHDAAKVDRVKIFAGIGPPGQAAVAVPAGAEGEHHVIAGLELGDAGPHLLHDSAALVAQHRGERNRNHLLLRDLICMADPAGGDLDHHLAFPRVL